jgi:uncharacterized protein (DUF983 family)
LATIKPTALALLSLRCPRCHTGPLFTHSALSLTKFIRMPECCPVCGFYYEPEPGFYFGAMYISSGFTTFIMLLTGMALNFLANDPPTWVYVAAVAAVVLPLTPLIYRYSRAMMLYAFGGTSFDSRYGRD